VVGSVSAKVVEDALADIRLLAHRLERVQVEIFCTATVIEGRLSPWAMAKRGRASVRPADAWRRERIMVGRWYDGVIRR